MVIPFSSGTEGMSWYSRNCENCKKAYLPKDGEYPSNKTMKNYIIIGKECKMKYDIDMAFIISEIPIETANKIGVRHPINEGDRSCWLNQTCMHFSDDDNDKYKSPKRPRPDAPNQMVMPFILDEIGVNELEKQLA